jgi:hypothetical protein
MSAREVFGVKSAPPDPGRVFYTITDADVRKSVIETEIGPIRLADVIGHVTPRDVGKRLYRVPCNDPEGGWFWQAENDRQRDERLAAV